MRRRRGIVASGAAWVMSAATPGAWADPAGGGTPRWISGYAMGSPAWTNAVALTPDGSTVVETGSSHFPGGHMATVAYYAATGPPTAAPTVPPRDYLVGF